MFRDVAQPGRALALGARSREFESRRPDHFHPLTGVFDPASRSPTMASDLLNITISAFRDQGWAFRSVSGVEVIESEFEAHHAKVPLHVQVYPDAGVVCVVARLSLPVPRSHRLTACELMMRTNKELNVGNFEVDWDDGTVMFRVTNIFTVDQADPRVIAGLVHTAVAEVDRLTPFMGEICRTPKGELLLLNIAKLMQRTELLPPPSELLGQAG